MGEYSYEVESRNCADFPYSVGTNVILAIFVRNLADQYQFYTMRGEWVQRQIHRARFSIPRFVQPDDLKDVLPYLPTGEVATDMIDQLQPLKMSAPRDAGAKLLEKMAAFHQAADDVFRRHADRLNRTYELIAPSKASAGRTSMNLGQIAMTVLQKKDKDELTPAMMWAVHRALAQSQNITRDVINYRQNIVYEIHPQQSLAEISQVRDWVRDYQEGIIQDVVEAFDDTPAETDLVRSDNPILSFIKKARVAVENSRRTRVLSPIGCLGPSSVKVAPVKPDMKTYRVVSSQKFSDNERIIVHYLDAWVTSRYLNPASNLSALGPMILRAVGAYEGFELDRTIGFTFLQELGIVAPWENRAIYSMINLKLPGHDRSSETTRMQQAAYNEMGRTKNVVLPKDSMEGMRKDWAELPVFCIDSADTLERDDGVSVEPIEGTDAECWLHVHVANPSAFIRPGSATAKYAAQLSESVYFPERKYPMLHPSLTAKHLSLADGRPCLTFSARMTTGGDILESKIAAGTVHNVLHLTPHTVGQELGINETEASESVSLVTVGGEMPTIPKPETKEAHKPLTPSHIMMLRKLLEIGEATRRRRTRNGAPDFYSSARIVNTYPQVYLGARVAPFQLNDRLITRYDGDPIISIEQTTTGYGLVAKMVSDLMILAGEVCASWCSARNIPIPYRGIMRNPEPPTSPETFREEILNPKVERDGHANQLDLVRYMRLLGQTAVSASPLEHHALGLPAYCKATSPLRRYTDMYTHWQIEAALRHEFTTGTSLVNSTISDKYLPFPRAAVETFAATARHRESKIASAKTGSSTHWITQALFRAFYFHEASLPEMFRVRTHIWHDTHQQGWLTEWGLRAELADNEAVERDGGFKVGDVWEARIKSVNPYHKALVMEPIRLLEREGEEGRMVQGLN